MADDGGTTNAAASPSATPLPPPADAQQPSLRIAYVTDAEGNLDYFRKVVELTEGVLSYDPAGPPPSAPTARLVLGGPEDVFVYGGDAVDKGPGDIRLCRQLVSLKRRHPDRVHLLVGNRDLNKLRYAAELAEDDLARPIDDIPPPHWDPSARTLRQHLESVAAAMGRSVAEANTKTERLKYIQVHTLGMPHTFEHRRRELAHLHGVADAAEVDDDEVARSFVDDVCEPGGALREFLESACVACTVGNTLFVHGAVDERTVGMVPSASTRFELPEPGSETPVTRCGTVAEWVGALNALLREGLEDFARRPRWDASRVTRGGEALMALQNREATAGRTVVSCCYGDGGVITTPRALRARRDALDAFGLDGDHRRFARLCADPSDGRVNAWLREGGVRRVVVGHKPTGDCPAVLAGHANGGVEVVSADTSFSDPLADDKRGVAASAVVISGTHGRNRLEISGVLRDGAAHRGRYPFVGDDGDDSGGVEGERVPVAAPAGEAGHGDRGDPLLGTMDKDGWWYKARLQGGGGGYRQTRGAGRQWETRDVPAAHV